MIIEKKKFGFDTIRLVLEDGAIDDAMRSGKYSYINAMTYKELGLPGFDVIRKKTTVIEFDPDTAKIFDKFSDTTKINIRRSYKNEHLRFVNEDPDHDGIYAVYREFEFSQGRIPMSRVEFGRYAYFSAYYDDRLISCISITVNPPYLRIRSLFSKRLETTEKELYKAIGNSTRRIIWEIAQWGSAKGYSWLDLASVNLTDPKKKGITDFKLSFGGSIIPEYLYIYKSKLFKALEFTATLRMRLRRLLYNIFRRRRIHS